jgi:hypothetical protein
MSIEVKPLSDEELQEIRRLVKVWRPNEFVNIGRLVATIDSLKAENASFKEENERIRKILAEPSYFMPQARLAALRETLGIVEPTEKCLFDELDSLRETLARVREWAEVHNGFASCSSKPLFDILGAASPPNEG